MLHRLLIALVLCITPALARAADHTINISAGDSARTSTPVTFQLSEGVKGPMHLVTDQNQDLPLYIAGQSATFILPNLAANQTATFKLQGGEANAEKISLTVKECSEDLGRRQTDSAIRAVPARRQPASSCLHRGGYIPPVYLLPASS